MRQSYITILIFVKWLSCNTLMGSLFRVVALVPRRAKNGTWMQYFVNNKMIFRKIFLALKRASHVKWILIFFCDGGGRRRNWVQIEPFYAPVSAEIAWEVILQSERQKSYITSSSASQSYITEGLQKLYFRGGPPLGYFAPPLIRSNCCTRTKWACFKLSHVISNRL